MNKLRQKKIGYIKVSKQAVTLCAGWFILAILSVFWHELVFYWKLSGSLLCIFLLLELNYILRKPNIKLQRIINHNLPVDAWSKVTIHIENHHCNELTGEIFDHYPAEFLARGLPQTVQIPYQKKTVIKYQIKPTTRGDATFTGIELKFFSKHKLWQRQIFFPITHTVKVFPNFAEISHYILLALDNRLSQLGVRKRQRRGEGNDFHQLREYRVGDPIKQIDWKASSKYRKLISKEYQDERDQQIIFLIDCSRKMRHREDKHVHLDQTLNAMLLLSYVACKQGDAVGFLSFSGKQRWVPPKKGTHMVNQLLNRTYDLQTSTQAADYISVAKTLMPLQRKRSLVIILTNTRNEDHDDLLSAIKLMQSKHLVLLADIREAVIFNELNHSIENMDQALRFHTINDYVTQRRLSHEAFEHTGAIALDVTAKQLPITIVNRYLDIKRSNRL